MLVVALGQAAATVVAAAATNSDTTRSLAVLSPNTSVTVVNDIQHPGVLTDMDQLLYTKAKIAANLNPWKAAFDDMVNTPSLASRTPHLEHMVIAPGYATWKAVDCNRDFTEPFDPATNGKSGHALACVDEQFDSTGAYTQALLWWYTGDETYAQRAVTILDAYSSILMDHIGVDGPLNAAWATENFVRAAEILRYTYTPSAGNSNFDNTDFTAMLNRAFLDIVRDDSSAVNGANWWTARNGNWEQTSIDAQMVIATYKSDQTLLRSAVSRWKNSVARFLYNSADGSTPANSNRLSNYPTEACAWSNNRPAACSSDGAGVAPRYVSGRNIETCRDYGHAALGIVASTNAAETAWIQGYDLFTPNKTRLMTAYSYASQSFLFAFKNQGVIHDSCYPVADAQMNDIHTGVLANSNNGQTTASELAYSAYVTRGLETKFREVPIPNYANSNLNLINGDPLATMITQFRGSGDQRLIDDDAHVSIWETLTHHDVGDGGKTKYVDEHFHTNALGGWTASGSGTWAWTSLSPNPGGYLTATQSAGSAWYRSPATNVADFSLRAAVKLVSGNVMGFSFRANTDYTNSYEAILDKNGGTITLRKRVGGVLSTVGTPAAFTVNPNQLYTLEVRAVGPSIKVLVDGEVKISATDSSHTTGGLALFTSGSGNEVQFDDVVATTPWGQ